MFFCWLFAEKYFFSNVLIHSWFFILVDLRLAETSFNWTNCFLVGCTRWLWFTGPSCRRSSSSCCSSVVDVAFYLVVVVALIHRELSIMYEVFVECLFVECFLAFLHRFRYLIAGFHLPSFEARSVSITSGCLVKQITGNSREGAHNPSPDPLL